MNAQERLNKRIILFKQVGMLDANAEISCKNRLYSTEDFALFIAFSLPHSLLKLNLTEDEENTFYGLAAGILGGSIRKTIEGKCSLHETITLDLEELDKRILSYANLVYSIATRIQGMYKKDKGCSIEKPA